MKKKNLLLTAEFRMPLLRQFVEQQEKILNPDYALEKI
jgi:hypothetical protein